MITDAMVEAACLVTFGPEVWKPTPSITKQYHRRIMHEALKAAERAAWRPIAEFPEDDMAPPILVYAAGVNGLPPIQAVARWHPSAGWCVDALRIVTHGRLLPEPPEET